MGGKLAGLDAVFFLDACSGKMRTTKDSPGPNMQDGPQDTPLVMIPNPREVVPIERHPRSLVTRVADPRYLHTARLPFD